MQRLVAWVRELARTSDLAGSALTRLIIIGCIVETWNDTGLTRPVTSPVTPSARVRRSLRHRRPLAVAHAWHGVAP